MNELKEALANNKEEILAGIRKDILDFLEQEIMAKGMFASADKKVLNDYIMSCLKDYLTYNFSLQSYDIYSITEQDVRDITGAYFFDRLNYKEDK